MAAMQTMKMTGQLTDTALLMKPSMWSQMIENFYVRIGYQYSSDYGVDMQLFETAGQGRPERTDNGVAARTRYRLPDDGQDYSYVGFEPVAGFGGKVELISSRIVEQK